MRPDTLIADRFVLERPVGAGGMGTVYRAVDRLSGAPVALKLAPLDDAQLRARAIAEADALATLDHAAIVRFVAHGLTPDGRPFLAMEWLDGEDLAQRLERDPLRAAEVALLGERVAGALSFLHARGVVHRDLKPSNLFLPGGEVAQVKLVDFGIVRVPRVAPRLTATGALVGTPAYMAPEQACGEREIAPAADLFALGAVLFECLAGRPAFTGASLMTVLARVLLEEPPRLDAVRTDLPPALVDLVARLLSKQPDERPDAPTVAAALSALLPALEGSVARGGTLAAPAITGDEQRLACVLLIRPAPEQASDAGASPTGDAGVGATLPAAERPFAVPPERDALERLLALVRPRGGRADRLADGGLVASWKDPGVPRDQAMRAARAALLARKRLPGAAMALACGMAELHRALPLGPALERAAALLDADEALDDAVPIDDITARLVEARFEIAPAALGHRLIAERAVDEEERRLLLGRAAPCVGRDRELRVLMDLLDECIAEPVARAVLVTAPAGTGKSRLRQELLRFVRQRGDVEVWAASADELAAGSPFVLLGDLLQRAAGAGAGDLIEHRQRRLRELVARHVPEADRARVAAFLGEIAAAPFSAAAYPALAAARREPGIMAEQVRRAFLDLIAAEATARPVLLVFEDLHWGDGPSLQLVDAAIARLSDRPFMVMALARPELHERFPDLWADRGAQEMRLYPLTRRAAAQLVRHALPDAGDALVQRLVDRADGHPFSLEELIRAAARGHGDALPETVAAMVQARLAELSSDERRLLRAASAFGEVFCKGESIRRRRNNPEWFRNVACCAWQLRRQARGGRGSCAGPWTRAGAGAGGRGSSSAGFLIAAPGARARGCGRSPSSSSAGRNSAPLPSSTWRRSRSARSVAVARASGRGAAPRLADIEVAARELEAAVVHLGTLGAVTDFEADVVQLGQWLYTWSSEGSPLAASSSGASVASSRIWPSTRAVPATRSAGAGASSARPLSAAPVIEAEAHAMTTVSPPSSSAIVRCAADFWAAAVRHPCG